MRDTLNLPELVERGDAFRRQARVRSRRTWALLAVTVALVALYTINGAASKSAAEWIAKLNETKPANTN